MSGSRTRFAHWAATNALIGLLSAPAVAADSVRLQGADLTAATTAAQAAVAALADGNAVVDTAQAFEVREGQGRTRVVPTRYAPRIPGELRNVDVCALVILESNGVPATIQTIGTGYTETVGCTGLDGIAFPDLDGDGHFDIALIYATLAPPNRSRKTPVVLRRDKSGAFAVDEQLGSALDEQGGITTLSALRRAASAKLKKVHH